MSRLPDAVDRSVLAAATIAWTGAVLGRSAPAAGAAVFGVAAALVIGYRSRRGAIAVVILGATIAAGAASTAREAATLNAELPEGRRTIAGRLAEDWRWYGDEAVVPVDPTHVLASGRWEAWPGPRMLLTATGDGVGLAGERVVADGTVRARPRRFRGDPVAGHLTATSVRLAGPADPLFAAANAVRDRVRDALLPHRGRAAAALLSGFLIGDVRDLPPGRLEELRRSGLSHFVAVSGSNVALFLTGLWLATGPLASGPRRRAALGLAGLVLFVVITRWEPSVVRASVMAGLVLAGRLTGHAVGPWTALGAAVTALLLWSPELAGDVGFQLSVAATGGVLAGAVGVAGHRPAWLWTAAVATLAAQVAVAPLLLAWFGAVPLLAPLANLVAAPLVAAATMVGGVGVATGLRPLVAAALLPADGVLAVAAAGAAGPQLGWGPVLVLAGGALLAAALPGFRPTVAAGAAVFTVATVAATGGRPPAEPIAVFLAVGQGDAALLRGPAGSTVLIDGGPDPATLRSALRQFGVSRIDLLIVSHRHADHVAGLVPLPAELPIGMIWAPPQAEADSLLASVLESANERGVPVLLPAPGDTAGIGPFHLEVIGPRRRYESPNDGSLVVRATAGATTILFPGDIESIAQRELGPLPADVMKVPHQGAATSDLDWLTESAGALAIVSVGPNRFGHPSEKVIAALRSAGSRVVRTDEHGDVVIRLQATP